MIIVVVLATAAAAAAVIFRVKSRDPIQVLESGARPAWAAQKLEAMALADPDDYRAQSWLIRLDLEAGRADQASSRLDMLRVKAPDNYYTFHAFCLSNMKQRNFSEAAKICGRALELSPSRTAEDLNLASSSYLETGQLEAALPLLQELRKKTPADPKVVNNLGYYHMQSGRNEQALPLFQEALKLDPAMPTARRNLARTYMKMGKYQESIDAYKLLLTAIPADLEALTQLSTIYAQQMKDAKTARSYYDLAVKNGLDKRQAAFLNVTVIDAENAGKGQPAGKE